MEELTYTWAERKVPKSIEKYVEFFLSEYFIYINLLDLHLVRIQNHWLKYVYTSVDKATAITLYLKKNWKKNSFAARWQIK